LGSLKPEEGAEGSIEKIAGAKLCVSQGRRKRGAGLHYGLGLSCEERQPRKILTGRIALRQAGKKSRRSIEWIKRRVGK